MFGKLENTLMDPSDRISKQTTPSKNIDSALKSITHDLLATSADTKKNTAKLELLEDKISDLTELLKSISGRNRHCESERDFSSGSDDPRRLCEYIKEMMAASTFHGIPNITTARKVWIRLFWIVLMTAGVGLAVWQSSLIFTEYSQFPVSTQFEIHSGNLTFPQVTVCNVNPYLKSKAKQHPVLRNLSILNSNSTNDFSEYYDFIDAIAENLTDEERISLSHNRPEFLQIHQGDDKFQCALFPTILNGNCYTLTKKQLVTPDTRLHFYVYVNVKPDEYIIPISDPGAMIFIREAGLYPITGFDNYVNLEPGYAVEVGINLETIDRLGGKYGNCMEHEETFRNVTGINYSQDVCRDTCLIREAVLQCGCYPRFLRTSTIRSKIPTILLNVPECTNKGIDCFYNAPYNCECKPSCRTRKYSIVSIRRNELVVLKEPCKYWPELCTNVSNKDKVTRSHVTAFRVYFQNEEHKVFTQIPSYPLSRFLSDLGGTFGLYVGASVLTLFELPQLAIVSVMYLTRFIHR